VLGRSTREPHARPGAGRVRPIERVRDPARAPHPGRGVRAVRAAAGLVLAIGGLAAPATALPLESLSAGGAEVRDILVLPGAPQQVLAATQGGGLWTSAD